ncbi:MAG: YbbR-like domain-containing protein [Acutalibacteraceae bacterium]
MADKKKLSFNDLLMNNKFVLVISLLAAIVLWAIVSMTVGDNVTRVIENVKVNVEESDNSLYKIFGFEETYVDVTVKGKKYLVSGGALSASDITVTASSNYVDSAGTQRLKLSASVNKNSEIKITSISKTSVDVFFDIPKTATLPVEVELKAETTVVPDGYIYEDPILPGSTITVNGPATEINKIEKFVATAEISEPLTSTQELEVSVSAVTANGKKAKYITFENNIENLSVTVPVSKVKEIPVSVRYVNVPSYYENNMPEVNIYPKTLKVAAAESVLESLETLNVGTISFNELLNKNNKFTFKLDNIDEVKIIDDISEVQVNVNCYPMSTKTFSASGENITLLNVPDGKTARLISDGIKGITVVGPASELKTLETENILAKVDLTDAGGGTESYNAVVYIKGAEKCWVYGSYSVKVRIE